MAYEPDWTDVLPVKAKAEQPAKVQPVAVHPAPGMAVTSGFMAFERVGYTGKTVIVRVRSKRDGGHLGLIRWYAPWRRYVFEVVPGAIFDEECLDELVREIAALDAARTARKRAS